MKKIFLAIAVLALAGFSSCSDFLEETAYSTIPDNGVYNTYDEADMAVQGIYATLTDKGGFGATWQSLGMFGTDEARCYFVGEKLNNYFYRQSNFSHTAGDVNNLNLWTTIYRGIGRANDVIDRVEAMSIRRGRKDTLQSEAKFMRAYFYFNLVQFWGGVPIETKAPTKESVLDNNVSRASVKDVYALIAGDIEFAKAHLPNQQNPGFEGRVTKYAAWGMAAKIYLTMASGSQYGVAGYEFFDPATYYGLARDNAWEVINNSSNRFGLQTDYNRIFSLDNKHNNEIMFEAGFAVNGPGSVYPKMGGPTKAGSAPNSYTYQNYGETGRAYNRPTVYLAMGVYGNTHTVAAGNGNVTAVASDDVRFGCNIVTQGLLSVDAYGDRAWGSMNTNPENWYSYKFSLKTGPMTGYTWTTTPMNQPILRYADLLLVYSEACGMLDLSDPEAYYGLNKVRQRARKAGTTPTYLKDYAAGDFATTDAFMDAVMDERLRELCFEGHRRPDLLRTARLFSAIEKMKTVDEGLSAKYSTSVNLTNRAVNADITQQNYDVNIKPYHILFPIPQAEMNVITNPDYYQNPGWPAAGIESEIVE